MHENGRGKLMLLALFFVGLVAATLDAIAGGGGLVTLPALLLAGLDPVAALATNKLQSSGGSVSAAIHFARRGHIEAWPGAAFAACAAMAAALGALSIGRLPADVLGGLVPVVLVVIAAYFALAHRPSAADARARLSPVAFALLANSLIGFYDGIFGPGTGSFLMVAFVTLLGYGTLRATAHTKLANAASNLGALVVFLGSGRVVWPVGIAMALGAVLGGQIGSRLAIRHGARMIRPLIVAMSLLMAARLLADPANPLAQAIRAHTHLASAPGANQRP